MTLQVICLFLVFLLNYKVNFKKPSDHLEIHPSLILQGSKISTKSQRTPKLTKTAFLVFIYLSS